MSFLNWFCCSWNWFSNLIRFKGTNDSISISEESMDSPWCELHIEIYKQSTLDTPNQPLIRRKEPSDFVYDSLNIFGRLRNIMTLVGCS